MSISDPFPLGFAMAAIAKCSHGHTHMMTTGQRYRIHVDGNIHQLKLLAFLGGIDLMFEADGAAPVGSFSITVDLCHVLETR